MKKLSILGIITVTIGLNFSFIKPAIAGPNNLIANPSLETSINGQPENWLQGKWGTNQTSFTYPVAGFDGTAAAKITVSAYTNGDAKWYFQEVPVTAGQSYVFSDYYISTITTRLVARFHLTNNTYSYLDIATLAPSTTWTKAERTITIPAAVAHVTVFHVIEGAGSLTVDNYSLDLPTVPPPTSNLIANPSVETSIGNQPQNWLQGKWGTNQTSFTYPVAGFDGNHAVRVDISSYTNGDAKWYFQDVPVTAGQTYLFSDYYKSDILSKMIVRYRFSNNAYSYLNIATLSPSAAWLKAERSIIVPAGVVSLTVLHLIESAGYLATDNFSLTLPTTPPPDPANFDTGMVSINFDDGWASFYTTALPKLNNAGLKATQYIVTQFLNKPNYMTVNEMLATQAAGHEIGSHTQTHPYLTRLTPQQILEEIRDSRTQLLNLGVNSITTFAYPYGDYNNLTDQIVRDSGYVGSRKSDLGYNSKNGNPYGLRIQSIEKNTTVEQIKSWIDSATLNKKWLVLLFHQIDSSGAQYSFSAANFQQIVDYLVQKNTSVVTTAQGLAKMQP